MKKINVLLALSVMFLVSLGFVSASECSTELCIPSLTGGPPVCHNIPTPGAPCTDDGNICTTDLCNINGICEHTPISGCGITPTNCDDSNPCTTDLSIPGYGCLNQPVQDGTICTDGTCQAGICVLTEEEPPLNCEDNNLCTNDAEIGGQCYHIPVFCNDNNADTQDSCNPQIGCVFTPNTPIVPEFGTVIAMLTALSALGVFFIVRRSK